MICLEVSFKRSQTIEGHLPTVGSLQEQDNKKLPKAGYREYFTPQLNAGQFRDRDTSEYSDEYNMGVTMGFGSTGNFGHTGGDPGMFSVIWFFKDKKMGRYLIINTDRDTQASGKDQKAIHDLLDEYHTRLNELGRMKK